MATKKGGGLKRCKGNIFQTPRGYLDGGFKYFLFSPLLGEMIQFDSYVLIGLKPPTSYTARWFLLKRKLYWGNLLIHWLDWIWFEFLDWSASWCVVYRRYIYMLNIYFYCFLFAFICVYKWPMSTVLKPGVFPKATLPPVPSIHPNPNFEDWCQCVVGLEREAWCLRTKSYPVPFWRFQGWTTP